MNVLLVAINAKYIHTNLAVRLLKVNSVLPVQYKEFTIKDTVFDVVFAIVASQPEVVGFSCYIWNIAFIREVLKELRQLIPSCKIILGGPEVSHNPLPYLQEKMADFVIKGEAELSFSHLIDRLSKNESYADVRGLVTRELETDTQLPVLSSLVSAYEEPNEYPQRIVYIETSRGCPYRCSYCLASTEKQVRFFPLEPLLDSLHVLIKSGARTFKFLDRTFNTHRQRMEKLFAFLFSRPEKNLSFQFEITGDIIDIDFIDWINAHAPRGMIRFEIGIQSIHDDVNLSVRRKQNTVALFEVIKRIRAADVIDLHLDLIVGLPGESLKRFKETFNASIQLKPKELQCGFLKLLYGTALRNEAASRSYVFNQTPPYEIIATLDLSEADIRLVHQIESALDIFYNKGFFPTAMKRCIDEVDDSFDFLLSLSQAMSMKIDNRRYQLADLALILDQVLIDYNLIDSRILLREDYLRHHDIKPKRWWSPYENASKLAVIKRCQQSFLSSESLGDLHKYLIFSMVSDVTVIGYYKPHHKLIMHYK